eukprot:442467_1
MERTSLASIHSLRDFELVQSMTCDDGCWLGGASTADCVSEWSDGTEWNYDPPWDPNGYSEGSGYPTEPYTCIIDNRTGLHDCHGQYFYPICNGICDEQPTWAPTMSPTSSPTLPPTSSPTLPPTSSPSVSPTSSPSTAPSVPPSSSPSMAPSVAPSIVP